jgi:cytochrome c-type biogenesis protein CcsB
MKKLFAYLASLRLAVCLLVLLLLGLSVGTIIESRSGAEVAGRLVYYAWWFLGLQGLFAVNLAMSLADLFPWGKKRVGFVIVHASLLLIFLGAAITFLFKVEGMMPLWEGESSSVIEHHDAEEKNVSRHELPFTVKLDTFVLDTYPGTMRPAGFASHVQITDRDTGKSFKAKIWMNHELHHRGYALFQSSYQQDGDRQMTVLAVSKDPGQTPVFAGYILLIAGMLVVLFTRIAQARERESRSANGSGSAQRALLALLLVAGAAAARAAVDPDQLRRLPVQHDGRTMPLDTLARETVLGISGKTSEQNQDPVITLTTWLADPETTANQPLIPLGSSAFAVAIGYPGNSTHATFLQIVGNPRAMQLVQDANLAEAQNRPRRDLLADAERLDRRMRLMQEILEQNLVQPIPVSADPRVAWSRPMVVSPEALSQLAAGPRLAGWPTAEKMDREVFYNRLNFPRLSWIILLASLIAAIAAGRGKSRLLDRLSFGLLAAGFAMMTWGIGLRWAVGERIPAANMYESMLFLAWGVGLFAVAAYLVLKSRIVVLNAAVMATLTMALVDLLPIDAFIHPIAPVLAGTPWLAIHVPIIMLGYAILALGVVVAHMQVGVSIFAPRNTELLDRMYDLNYWYTFTGSIFLIAGIITGSMWAASSWGRYWGWDPKEVWSLVAFLAYMAILHAKLDRLIGKFGVAVISILAFQTILMTYLGVNFVLSTGMHSYGMGDSPVVMWMVLLAAAEAIFLGWGVLAHRKHNLPEIEQD